MAKGAYIGVSGKARKIKKIYIGVNGKARKVKKAYIGINGKARLFYQAYGSTMPVYSNHQTDHSYIREYCSAGSVGGYAVFAGGEDKESHVQTGSNTWNSTENNTFHAYNSSFTKYRASFTQAWGVCESIAINNGSVLVICDWKMPSDYESGTWYTINSSLTVGMPIGPKNGSVDSSEMLTNSSMAAINGCIFRYGGSNTHYSTQEYEGYTYDIAQPMPATTMYKYDSSFTRSSITVPSSAGVDNGGNGSGCSFGNHYAVLLGSLSRSGKDPYTGQLGDGYKMKALVVNPSFTTSVFTFSSISNKYESEYNNAYADSFMRCQLSANSAYMISEAYAKGQYSYCYTYNQGNSTHYPVNKKWEAVNSSLTSTLVDFGYGADSTWRNRHISGSYGDFYVHSRVKSNAQVDNFFSLMFVNKNLTKTMITSGYSGSNSGAGQIANADNALYVMDGSSWPATTNTTGLLRFVG